jgi:hypothetical protein
VHSFSAIGHCRPAGTWPGQLRAGTDLGWKPLHDDPLAVFAAGDRHATA